MKSVQRLENFSDKRVVVLTLSGVVTRADLAAMMMKMGQACSSYRGGKFALIADLRDLQPLAPDAAEAMGAGIEIGRQNGVVLCAHLSNSGIIRLQTTRLSREASPTDATVFDVVSMEEAWRLIAERRADLVEAPQKSA